MYTSIIFAECEPSNPYTGTVTHWSSWSFLKTALGSESHPTCFFCLPPLFIKELSGMYCNSALKVLPAYYYVLSLVFHQTSLTESLACWICFLGDLKRHTWLGFKLLYCTSCMLSLACIWHMLTKDEVYMRCIWTQSVAWTKCSPACCNIIKPPSTIPQTWA